MRDFLRILILAGIATSALFATTAQADSITFPNALHTVINFSHTSGGPTSSGSGAIPQFAYFDPSLGTLTRVEISYLGSGMSHKTLNVEPDSYTVFAEYEAQLSSTSGSMSEVRRDLSSGGVNVADSGPFEFSEGNSTLFSFSITDHLDLFIYGGELTLTMTGFITVSGRDTGFLYTGLADDFTGASQLEDITYFYTPIPEPSTGLHLAIGLFLMCVSQRRRMR